MMYLPSYEPLPKAVTCTFEILEKSAFVFDHGGFVNLASGAVTFFHSPLESTVENGKTLTPWLPLDPV